MRPRRYDRFVLIGLCWLYGRSEFPPPPLLPDFLYTYGAGYGRICDFWCSHMGTMNVCLPTGGLHVSLHANLLDN